MLCQGVQFKKVKASQNKMYRLDIQEGLTKQQNKEKIVNVIIYLHLKQ